VSDPLIDELRGRISAGDRVILEALNTRLRLVAELKRYKESRGIDFHDPQREASMLQELVQANTGPLSEEGVRELLTTLLDLTKRELS
jgi:chorismate mutase